MILFLWISRFFFDFLLFLKQWFLIFEGSEGEEKGVNNRDGEEEVKQKWKSDEEVVKKWLKSSWKVIKK